MTVRGFPLRRGAFISGAAAAMTAGSLRPVHAQAAPAVRMGCGPAAEEQLWLMAVRPDLCPNQGKSYTYSLTQFPAANMRITAFEAGQLDAASSSMVGLLFAASKGVDVRIVANLGAESRKYFSTSYFALTESGITLNAQSLKGKTFGINGYRQSLELWARIAVQKLGLDPSRDVNWVIVPLPEMGNALRAKKIDVGVFPEAFAVEEQKKGGVKRLFTSASVSGIEEEFDVYFSPKFIAAHPVAVRGWIADFRNVTKYLQQNERAARQALIDNGKWIKVPDPASYVATTQANDLDRTYMKPKLATLEKLEGELVKAGWIEKPMDVAKLVDNAFTA